MKLSNILTANLCKNFFIHFQCIYTLSGLILSNFLFKLFFRFLFRLLLFLRLLIITILLLSWLPRLWVRLQLQFMCFTLHGTLVGVPIGRKRAIVAIAICMTIGDCSIAYLTLWVVLGWFSGWTRRRQFLGRLIITSAFLAVAGEEQDTEADDNTYDEDDDEIWEDGGVFIWVFLAAPIIVIFTHGSAILVVINLFQGWLLIVDKKNCLLGINLVRSCSRLRGFSSFCRIRLTRRFFRWLSCGFFYIRIILLKWCRLSNWLRLFFFSWVSGSVW